MEWIKFKDKFPPEGTIIYYDGKFVTVAHVTMDQEIYSDGYYCNNTKTYHGGFNYDDCSCPLIIHDEYYWAGIPLPCNP